MDFGWGGRVSVTVGEVNMFEEKSLTVPWDGVNPVTKDDVDAALKLEGAGTITTRPTTMILFSTPNLSHEPDLDPVLADAVEHLAHLVKLRHPSDCAVQATLTVAHLAELVGVGGICVQPGASVEEQVAGLERELGRLVRQR